MRDSDIIVRVTTTRDFIVPTHALDHFKEMVRNAGGAGIPPHIQHGYGIGYTHKVIDIQEIGAAGELGDEYHAYFQADQEEQDNPWPQAPPDPFEGQTFDSEEEAWEAAKDYVSRRLNRLTEED
jgi:hypothetical protein